MTEAIGRVGVIGLGTMGGTFARQLLADDIEVIGYDIDEDALASAAEGGVEPKTSVEAVASSVDAVVTSLPGPPDVEAVYLDEGLLTAATADLVALEMSTIDPETTQRVAAAAADHGVDFLDAPVSGGLGKAERGQLQIMVGGDTEILERPAVQGVLGSLGSTICHTGGTGTGHATKLLNNLISSGNRVIWMEAAAVAATMDIDWHGYMRAIAGSSGSSYSFRKHMPRVLNRDFDGGNFSLALSRKDKDLAMDLAESAGFPLIFGSVMRQLYNEPVAAGIAEEASSNVMIEFFEQHIDGTVEADAEIDEDFLKWKEIGEELADR